MKIGNICQFLDGEKLFGRPYPYLEAKYLRGKSESTICDNGKLIRKGTRIILVDGENSGKVFIATEDGYMVSTFKVLFIPEALFSDYVLMFLMLRKMQFRNNKTGSAIPHLNKKLFFNMPIPIPPLAEQKRIVARIEELLPLVAEYDAAESRLTELNSTFPDKLRESILQQAVQGKLTEREFTDEPASELLKRIKTEKEQLIKEGKLKKEKPLPPIAANEITFEIPENWVWVRFAEVIDVATNLVSQNDYGEYKHIAPDNIIKRTGKLLHCNTVSEDKVLSPNHFVKAGHIIYSKIRPLLRKVVIAPFDCLCSADMYPLETSLNQEFVMLVLLSECFNLHVAAITSSRVKMPKINQKELSRIVIPLPPLAKQKRIVARVNELLALCDEMK